MADRLHGDGMELTVPKLGDTRGWGLKLAQDEARGGSEADADHWLHHPGSEHWVPPLALHCLPGVVLKNLLRLLGVMGAETAAWGP